MHNLHRWPIRRMQAADIPQEIPQNRIDLKEQSLPMIFVVEAGLPGFLKRLHGAIPGRGIRALLPDPPYPADKIPRPRDQDHQDHETAHNDAHLPHEDGPFVLDRPLDVFHRAEVGGRP